MLVFIVRRLLYSIPVLLATSFLIFTAVSLSGDPAARLKANPRFDEASLRIIEKKYKLDKPIPLRYVYWLKDVTTNKLGTSLNTNQPLWPDIKRVMSHTAQLIITSSILAILIGVLVGVYSAIRQYSIFDYTATSLSFLGFAMPTFWLALLLQILFVNIYLKWDVRIFYTSGLNNPDEGAFSLDRVQHLALPVATLVIIDFALYSRFMRASMLEVINSDYVRTARAKGVQEWRVILHHVVRNALIPLVTVVALNVGALLGGAIVTESVFSLDGMGFYFRSKLQQLDLYAVMAWLLVTSMIVILANLLADIVYGYLDPRIRYS
jgi:ABC-type dipeptide/oligopeptide/nickel transport system permease component